ITQFNAEAVEAFGVVHINTGAAIEDVPIAPLGVHLQESHSISQSLRDNLHPLTIPVEHTSDEVRLGDVGDEHLDNTFVLKDAAHLLFARLSQPLSPRGVDFG